MKTVKSDKSEISFYAQQAQSLEGEISIPRLITELKIGFTKASAVFEKLKGISGIELAITPEVEAEEIRSGQPITQEMVDEANNEPVPDFVRVDATENVVPEILEISMPVGRLEGTFTVDNSEMAIVEAACQPMNLGQSLGEVLRDFNLGDHLTCCTPKEGTDDLKIGKAITVLAGVRNWTELGLGDLINELEDRGWKNVVPQVISHLNLEDSHSTLDKYSRVARNIPNDLRELPNLHFTHLAEAGCSKFSKDAEEQKKIIREVLTEASEQSLNVAQTRQLCLAKKGRTTTPTPPPAQKKHGRFIVVFASSCTESITCDELPDATEDHIVIDLESASIACSGCSAGVPVWSPLIYEKLPATESEIVIEE